MVELPASLVILGPPRTKKNHSRVVRAGRRLRIVPSAAHERWFASAMPQLRTQWRRPPLNVPVLVTALFYRDRAVGDAVNYYQALADALEHAGIVEDDQQIRAWDGSRLHRDSKRPRIELTITKCNEETANDQ